MFKVYWTTFQVMVKPPDYEPEKMKFTSACSKDFGSDQMVEAMKFMEDLRKDPDNSFVTMASENPNSVGKPGVDEVGPDYNWTKRRGNMPGLKK